MTAPKARLPRQDSSPPGRKRALGGAAGSARRASVSTQGDVPMDLLQRALERTPSAPSAQNENITQDLLAKLLAQLPPEEGESTDAAESAAFRNSTSNEIAERHARRTKGLGSAGSETDMDNESGNAPGKAAHKAKRRRTEESSRPETVDGSEHASASPGPQGPASDRPGNARALRVPEDENFPIGLPHPLIDALCPGGPELNSLEHQKLVDATGLLQGMGMHALEPLALYTKRQLYELMASVAEVWKNSGKAAWKKRINKIKGNARSRRAPRNVLDKKELQEIAELEAKIRQREIWEQQEKLRMSLLNKDDAAAASAAAAAAAAASEDAEQKSAFARASSMPPRVLPPNEIPTARKLVSAMPLPRPAGSSPQSSAASVADALLPLPSVSSFAFSSAFRSGNG